ncbi:MAG: serine protease [Gemmatimonadaceae bacterium]
MTLILDETIDDLRSAVDTLDRERVEAVCRNLVARIHGSESPLPESAIKGVLNTLRRKRFFSQMQYVADALIQAGQDYPVVRRQYAQALIDQGALVAARAVLKELVSDTSDDPTENAEVRGLLGRTEKQSYVDTRRSAAAGNRAHRSGPDRYYAAMRSAIKYYQEAFEEDPTSNYWHGINAVACAARAQRDGISGSTFGDPAVVAAGILKRIEAKGEKASIWEVATAIEACVAMGDRRSAAGWALDYVMSTALPDGSFADAFEIASTLRQLTEVWELAPGRDPGKTLLPILLGGLLQRENGRVDATPAQVRSSADVVKAILEEARQSGAQSHFEKVFGADAFVSLNTYALGLKRARTVARIGLEASGRGCGTGFLLRGRDLCDRYGGQCVLVTNSHVVSAKEENAPAARPDEAVITFEALSGSSMNDVPSYSVGKILWESSVQELDATVIALDRPVDGLEGDDCCEVAKSLPLNNQRGRVYIIGHPAGGALSYSIQDNILIDHEDPWLHYRAPTEGGSSGSPVYNTQWKLIGLHHAGSSEVPRLRKQEGRYEANEGIWIQSIRRALASQ